MTATTPARPFPSLALPASSWAGLPITLECLPGQAEIGSTVLPHASMALVRSGGGKRWYRSEGRMRELHTAPGMIELYEAGYQIDSARWDCRPGQVIHIELPDFAVNRLLPDSAHPLEISTRHECFDARLASLADALWNEASSEAPMGSMYAEGLTLALLGLLSAQTTDGHAPAPSRVGRFSRRDRERLRELIAAQLSGDLRIERLAAAVCMSPRHFTRVFKATFGVAPHAYVLGQRVETAARVLLREKDRSLADIASEFGFSSQAHFTETFRRRMGATPARWRSQARS